MEDDTDDTDWTSRLYFVDDYNLPVRILRPSGLICICVGRLSIAVLFASVQECRNSAHTRVLIQLCVTFRRRLQTGTCNLFSWTITNCRVNVTVSMSAGQRLACSVRSVIRYILYETTQTGRRDFISRTITYFWCEYYGRLVPSAFVLEVSS